VESGNLEWNGSSWAFLPEGKVGKELDPMQRGKKKKIESK
jgi:hypothetical protein